ncbi:YcxB family protein [bacterium]|nr:YcxB family protein [bacterium]
MLDCKSDMTLSYRNTFRDQLAFILYHLLHTPFCLLFLVGLCLIVTFGSVIPAVQRVSTDQPMFAVVIAFILIELLLALFFFGFVVVFTILSMISRKNKTVFCEKTITLGEEAFVNESEYGKSETRWTIVQKLACTRRHIFIYLNQQAAIVIPRSAFESSEQWDAFYAICRQRIKNAAERIVDKVG